MINSGIETTNFTLNLLTIPGLECVQKPVEAGESTTVSCEIRNVWKQKSMGIQNEATFLVTNVASHDSAFFVIGAPQYVTKDGASVVEHLHFIQSNETILFLSSDALAIWVVIAVLVVFLIRHRYWLQIGRAQRKTILGRRRRWSFGIENWWQVEWYTVPAPNAVWWLGYLHITMRQTDSIAKLTILHYLHLHMHS